jgi:hypothetical protein
MFSFYSPGKMEECVLEIRKTGTKNLYVADKGQFAGLKDKKCSIGKNYVDLVLNRNAKGISTISYTTTGSKVIKSAKEIPEYIEDAVDAFLNKDPTRICLYFDEDMFLDKEFFKVVSAAEPAKRVDVKPKVSEPRKPADTGRAKVEQSPPKPARATATKVLGQDHESLMELISAKFEESAANTRTHNDRVLAKLDSVTKDVSSLATAVNAKFDGISRELKLVNQRPAAGSSPPRPVDSGIGRAPSPDRRKVEEPEVLNPPSPRGGKDDARPSKSPRVSPRASPAKGATKSIIVIGAPKTSPKLGTDRGSSR